jgi:hypothetical protein
VDVLLGRAEFFVSAAEESDMLASNQSQDRTIYRQTLPLADEQVLELAGKLHKDNLPENRAYIYDHFLDNCSTKPRDLIDSVTGEALSAMPRSQGATYRELVDERLGYSWVLIFGSDLFLGRRLDRGITLYEGMFLPRQLREAVSRQLGAEPEMLYQRKAPLPPSRPGAARRWTWLLMGVFAVTTGLAIFRGSKAARIVAGSTMGGLGALLFLMALASPEAEIRYNENVLVFLPFDLLYLVGRGKPLDWYARFRIAELGMVGGLAAAGVFLQPLWPFWFAALVPAVAVTFRKTAST